LGYFSNQFVVRRMHADVRVHPSVRQEDQEAVTVR
jgi:hypothetical protein